MRSPTFTLLTELLLLVSSATATLYPVGILAPERIGDDRLLSGTSLERRGTHVATFDQLIDHKNPSLGTFSQRYFWNDDFYAGAGAPVMLFTPGEIAADGYEGYLTNITLQGTFMQTNKAAGILLEHRYWGQSSPYDDLTAETLQQLTLENAIADLVYFAKNVRPPYDLEGASTPDKAPWILSGCSYSGALTGWTNSIAPGTFWAYHGSSAVVEAVGDFWQYFAVVENAMPRNCSTDVKKVVKYLDKVLSGTDEKRKLAVKKKFGLEKVEYDDDFVTALLGPLVGWQSVSFASGYNEFHQFCDYVENKWPGSDKPTPGEEGVGLCSAFNGYAKYSREILLPGTCAGYKYWTDELETACFDSHNASNPLYRDTSVDNDSGRQWFWMLCNQPFKYWQSHHNGAKDNIASKLVQPKYYEDQCEIYFPSRGTPNTYGINKGRTAEDVNAYTDGWNNVNTTRFIWINGELDPWRDSTVSADQRPGGPLQSTEQVPVHVIPGAAHCGDLSVRNANANEGLLKIFNAEVATMKGWVDDFYTTKGIKRP